MKNRGRLEVIAAILKAVGKEESRAKIMYKAMLSNDQCKLYLKSLVESGLLYEVNNGGKVVYRPTPKAGKFLSYFDQIHECLPVGIDKALVTSMALTT